MILANIHSDINLLKEQYISDYKADQQSLKSKKDLEETTAMINELKDIYVRLGLLDIRQSNINNACGSLRTLIADLRTSLSDFKGCKKLEADIENMNRYIQQIDLTTAHLKE